MALKLILDSLEGMDDAAKALYLEKDGKFHLDVEGIENADSVKAALDRERKAARDATKASEKWRALGKTPEEIQELLEAQREAEEQKATRAGEWDKLKAQMNEKHAADIAQRDESITALRKRLNAELVDAKAVAAIAAAKGSPDLLLPHIQRQTKVDDDFNVQVVDGKGDPRVNGKGEPLSIADLVSEMRQSEVFGRAFDGGNSGTGKEPGHGGHGGGNGSKTMSRADFEKLSPNDRQKIMAEGKIQVVDAAA